MNRFRDTFEFMDDERRERERFADNESVRGNDSVRSDFVLIDLSLALHYETPARGTNPGAILVSNNADEARAVWIPKSRCEFEKHNSYVTGCRKDGSSSKCQSVTVTLSERLAKEKGLV